MSCGDEQELEVPIEQIVPTTEDDMEAGANHEVAAEEEAIQEETVTTEVVEDEVVNAGVTMLNGDEVAVVVEEQPEQVLPAQGGHQVFVEETYGYVINDGDNLTVQEEVVISENGHQVPDIHNVASNETVVYTANGEEEVVQLKEEEIIGAPSTETEMSVAMDLAKLSQGHFENAYQVAPAPQPPVPKIQPHPPCGAEKPRLSYAQMIAEALMQAEERMLPLCEIYTYINQKYPYFRMDVKSWQNAIRHNLTLNPSFHKVPRPNNEGRGNFWKMEDGAERQIFKRTIRSHHYKMARFDSKTGKSVPRPNRHQQEKVIVMSPQEEVQAATTAIVETSVPVAPAAATEEVKTNGTVVVANGVSGSANLQTLTLNKAFLQQNAVQTVGGKQIVFIALPAGSRVAS